MMAPTKRLINKKLWFVILPCSAIIYGLSGFYQIQPDERGVVLRFGAISESDISPGLHYHLPWPIEKSLAPKTTEIRTINVGFDIVDQVLGLEPESLETQRLTGDTNILTIKMTIQYMVSEPANYLFSAENPVVLIRDIGQVVLTRLVAEKEVDWILTTGRNELQVQIKEQSQSFLDMLQAGVRITSVNLLAIEPPSEVNEAFKDVASAKIEREEMISKAQTQANFILPGARAEAHAIVEKAKATKTESVTEAQALAKTFAGIQEQYALAPEITRKRMYLEAIAECLVKDRIIIPPTKETVLKIITNPTDLETVVSQ